jgi:raffinose/stachyose/melibiose transport system permease protein
MAANVPIVAAAKRRSFLWSTSLTYGVALAVAGVSVGPVLYAILGGFRSNAQINADPAGLPNPWVWQTYVNVLSKPTFWSAASNSLVIAVSATIGVTALGVCAAFVLARYRFRGREGLYTFFVLGLLFPATAGILPLFLLLGNLGLTNNYLGVILPQIAFGLPITIVILRPFLTAIPSELEDASAIDGASKLGFFWRVLLPLSKPALVTVAVLAFVGSWNSYALPCSSSRTGRCTPCRSPCRRRPGASSPRTRRPSSRSPRCPCCRPCCSSCSPSGRSSADCRARSRGSAVKR